MSAQRLTDLSPEYATRVLHDVPMAKHTSWHVGGPADYFFTPRDAADLAAFVRQLPPEVPMLWIGLGSNLLVRDGGIRGAVISTHGALGALERLSATRIRVEAGVPCARIARQCVKWGLGPAEFFAGIPGTEWFIGAQLEFERAPGVSTDAIRDLLDKRRETQPIGEWSCGSVFTNPPGDHAARLIESAGLKGFRIGDASVSEKHANFIINHGNARAGDVEALIEHVRRTVAQVHGIELSTEVRIVGAPA
jgi:UDP-N-acetylmuramate dehydrogenase